MHELFYTPAHIPDSQIHCVTEDNWDTYDEEIRMVEVRCDGHWFRMGWTFL